MRRITEPNTTTENEKTPPSVVVRRPALFGKLHLQTWIWKFVQRLENLEPTTVLDITKRSSLRDELRPRLVTKTQLGLHGDVPNRTKYAAVVRFSVGSTDERNCRIFITAKAQADINEKMRVLFLELAHSHVLKEKRKNNTDATAVLADFLDMYGLTSDELDPETLRESLTKAEYRLRDVRGMTSNHAAHRQPKKAQPTGQWLLELH